MPCKHDQITKKVFVSSWLLVKYFYSIDSTLIDTESLLIIIDALYLISSRVSRNAFKRKICHPVMHPQ